MPSLTQLPTDNLYKFVALAGLGLIAFGIYLLVTHWLRIEAQLIVYQRALARTDVKLTYLENEAQEQRLDQLTPERLSELREHTRDVRLLHEEDKINSQALGRLLRQLGLIASVSRVALGLGGLLTVVGFTLWYIKTQKPQDELLELQLKNAIVSHK